MSDLEQNEIDKNEVLVSVIIPAYNEVEHINACLSALSEQSFPADKYEVIVVDDGSTDGTTEMVKQFSWVKLICQDNQGPAAARNNGVKISKGRVILFTDADCQPDFHWVEQLSKPILEGQAIGVKGIYRTHQDQLAARFAQIEFEDRYDLLKRRDNIDFVDSHSAGFDKEAYLSVGGFDPHFPVANNEDVDLSYKLSNKGYRMVFNPKAIVYHQHPSTLKEYLRVKFLRAYWRLMVYKRYPSKVLQDSYTPQTLKLQILLAFIALIALALSILSSFWFKVFLFSAAIFLLSTIPLVIKALKRDPKVALVAPGFIFLRSVVFAVGVAAGTLSRSKEDLLFPTLLILADIVSCAISYFGAYWMRSVLLVIFFQDQLPPFEHPLKVYVILFPFVMAFWLTIFAFMHLYTSGRSMSRLIEYLQVIKACSLVTLTVVTGSFLIKFEFSRPMIVLFWFNSMVITNIFRHFIRNLQQNMLQKGYNAIRAVILGAGETGKVVYNQMVKETALGYHIVGFVDDGCQKDSEVLPGVKILGSTDELLDVIRSNAIDEVLIAKPALPHKEILNIVVSCEEARVSFKIVSDLFDIITSNITLERAGNIPVVDLASRKFGFFRKAVKRFMDIIISLVLLLLSLPFWLIIAYLIKRDSPGPVFFIHTRIGYKGKPFRIIKFRTMTVDCDPYQDAPNDKCDSRITQFGAYLRRTSLDELPQLINVLKGDMSLVGPRPEMPQIVEKYDKWQLKRLEVKPGVTGLWQILGRKERPLADNLQYDFYYIKNQSILLDIIILLKTIPMVILGKGAF